MTEIKKIFRDLQEKKNFNNKQELFIWLKDLLGVHLDTVRRWENHISPESDYYPKLQNLYRNEMGISEDFEDKKKSPGKKRKYFQLEIDQKLRDELNREAKIIGIPTYIYVQRILKRRADI